MNEYIHKIITEIYSSFDNIDPKEQIEKNPDKLFHKFFHEFLNDYLFISITKILNSDKKEEEKKRAERKDSVMLQIIYTFFYKPFRLVGVGAVSREENRGETRQDKTAYEE